MGEGNLRRRNDSDSLMSREEKTNQPNKPTETERQTQCWFGIAQYENTWMSIATILHNHEVIKDHLSMASYSSQNKTCVLL